jgi:hypothetical protein
MANKPTLPTKEQIDELRASGKTREVIAAEFGVTLGTLKRLITEYGCVPRLTKAAVKRAAKPARVREKPRYADPGEGEGLMDRAKVILGDRMSERYGCYYLDGRPTSSWRLVEEAGLPLGSKRQVT